MLGFWQRQLKSAVPDDIAQWLREQVADIQILWSHVGRMNRSRGMWKAREWSHSRRRILTNAWTRNYDGLYLDSQLMCLTRLAYPSRSTNVSLMSILTGFAQWPQLHQTLRTNSQVSPERASALDPTTDKRGVQKSCQTR